MADDLHRGFHKGKYNLPDIGKNSSKPEEFPRLKKIEKGYNHLKEQYDTAERLLVKRNFDPELNKLLGKVGPFKKAIKKGKLSVHAEIDGVNSNRTYLSFKYKL